MHTLTLVLIPDECGDSIVLDFVGPLLGDNSYNCILTMTSHLGSDYHLIPTRTDASAEDTALIIFDNWYCENGLPNNFVSDRDKLFILHFWKALTKLTGILLIMLSAYHPETIIHQTTNWRLDNAVEAIHFIKNTSPDPVTLQTVRNVLK